MATKKIPFIWTNDDITVGRRQSMEGQLAFLDRHGVKGTFFVVPCPGGRQVLTEDQPLIAMLKDAMLAGHEAHQHSVTHQCIENGTADLRMFDLMGDQAKIDYSNQRHLYERLWELEVIQPHIDWGRRVWIEAFGAPSPGYRPGCGAFCANMYRALENLGFAWCSARLVSMTGWMWSAGKFDYPVGFDGVARPYELGGLVEYPILDDVAFVVTPDRVNQFAELGWQHWERCVQQQVPYLLVSHPFALERNEGAGYMVHDKLIPRILDSGLAEPMTLHAYHQRVKAGEFPLLEDHEREPDGSVLPDWHALGRQQPVA